jgi:uncharacterized protein (TIGR04255 family)
MKIKEIFPNPTVKQVIFQIVFPNLFYIENKIGDLQMKIMKEFPESSLVFQRQILFTDVGPEVKHESIQSDLEKGVARKIWQFRSSKNFQLNVLGDSLDISSQFHKTYDLGDGEKFRGIIKFVLDCFLETMPIPIINRIGLRYIDECPITSKDNSTFRSYYNTAFPLSRFNLADADEMDFKTVIKKGRYFLRYAESLKKIDTEYKLILDFDGFAKNIVPENCLKVTDDLHKIIRKEFEQTIRGPVIKYMKLKKES